MSEGETSGYVGKLSVDLSQRDKLFDEVARLVVQHQQGSTSLIQRKLNLGYNRAGRIMDQLEAAGIVGPFEGSNSREVFICDFVELDKKLHDINNGIFEGNYIKEHNHRRIENEKEIEDRIKENTENLERKEIRDRLLEKERKKALEREIKDQLIKDGLIFNSRKNNENKREPIPKEIMNQVWNRDGGACVECGSKENLEFDHIIPVSLGGATTYRNLQLLCQECNRKKSNKI